LCACRFCDQDPQWAGQEATQSLGVESSSGKYRTLNATLCATAALDDGTGNLYTPCELDCRQRCDGTEFDVMGLGQRRALEVFFFFDTFNFRFCHLSSHGFFVVVVVVCLFVCLFWSQLLLEKNSLTVFPKFPNPDNSLGGGEVRIENSLYGSATLSIEALNSTIGDASVLLISPLNGVSDVKQFTIRSSHDGQLRFEEQVNTSESRVVDCVKLF
jgi:hypothetical protein